MYSGLSILCHSYHSKGSVRGSRQHQTERTPPKLEQVSPAVRLLANNRIMTRLMDDATFVAKDYLNYTEIIVHLVIRYTLQSLLLFDEKYRVRQSSTFTLCNRNLQVPGNQRKSATGSGVAQR